MLSLALRQAAYPADAALGSLLDYVARLQAALGTPLWDLAASELTSGRVPAAVSLQAQPAPATEAHAAAAGRGGGGGRPQGRPRKDAALSAPFAPPSSPAAARAAGAERATHVTQTLLSRVYGSPPAEDAAEELAAVGAAADAMAMFTQEPEAYDASQPGAFRQAQAGAGPPHPPWPGPPCARGARRSATPSARGSRRGEGSVHFPAGARLRSGRFRPLLSSSSAYSQPTAHAKKNSASANCRPRSRFQLYY